MKGQWVRKPSIGASVIFVHGILSSTETAWTGSSGKSWPTLLENEPQFKNLGIYTFDYETGLFSGSYRLGDAVDALKEYLRLDGLYKAKKLIFVCIAWAASSSESSL